MAINKDKLERMSREASGQNDKKSLKIAPPQSDSSYPDKATIYFNRGSEGPEMGRRVFETCRDNNISQQQLFWFCLNMGLAEYGYDDLPFPEDRRKEKSS